jgi:hypothetical protein
MLAQQTQDDRLGGILLLSPTEILKEFLNFPECRDGGNAVTDSGDWHGTVSFFILLTCV